MSFYTRLQVVELLEVTESFVVELERESIVSVDAATEEAGEFSEAMLERIRVAHTLVHELDVNLAGVAIILRLREELSDLRHSLEKVLSELRHTREPR